MQHLAIIPDGNRRWAAKNKLQSFMGHKKGLQALNTVLEFCLKNNIKYLSFYAFSLENFNRSEEEKNYLFTLLDEFSNQLPNLIKNQIKVRFIGKQDLFPLSVKKTIDLIETETKDFNKLFLNILFCYGSKTEITYAARTLAQKVKDGLLEPSQIDENLLGDHLWTAKTPDPDLIIRTSNMFRLSNFLLYQAAYSEFMFLDCFWPEITEKHLEDCFNKFKEIKRNFGS